MSSEEKRLKRPFLKFSIIFVGVVAVSVYFLVDFRSPEARAEGHYQSALELLQSGDAARADVELRNVFDLDGQHRDARALYADLQRDEGDLAEAYSQYLRLVEQYPDDLEGQLALAELSFEGLNWEDMERYSEAALNLAPEDLRAQAMGLVLDYRDARIDDDAAAVVSVIQRVDELAMNLDDSLALQQVLIDNYMLENSPAKALPHIDKAIQLRPDRFDLYQNKIQALQATKQDGALTDFLVSTQAQFPDNSDVQSLLINWYVSRNETQSAEALLRDIAANAADEDKVSASMAVVRFKQQTRGLAPARLELVSLVESSEDENDVLLYRGALAALDFDMGNRRQALESFQTMLADVEPSETSRDIRVSYARALSATGNIVGAREQIERVLAEDGTQADALKMRAVWQLNDSLPDDAIQTLRLALNKNPRDAEALNLLSSAYQETGSRVLAGEQLALAVESSGYSPAQVGVYVNFLIEDERGEAAIPVLVDALKRNPGNPDLASQLASLYIEGGDGFRARSLIEDLEASGNENHRRNAALLRGRLALKNGEIPQSDGAIDVPVVSALLQELVVEGKSDEARQYISNNRALSPDNAGLKQLEAEFLATVGEAERAEGLYRELIEDYPNVSAPIIGLNRLLLDRGRQQDASALLADAIEKNPDDINLRLAEIKSFEADGDVEKTIALAETLYAENPENVLIANNLASLLSTGRDDQESLERARDIAAGLKEYDEPAIQDTYGWIQYRLGNYDVALPYLESAARQMESDSQVQFHLASVFAAMGRSEDARDYLNKAQAGTDDPTLLAKIGSALKGL